MDPRDFYFQVASADGDRKLMWPVRQRVSHSWVWPVIVKRCQVVEKQDNAKKVVEAFTTDQTRPSRKPPDLSKNAHFQLTPIPGMSPQRPKNPASKEGKHQ
jgi:hypothetical protein